MNAKVVFKSNIKYFVYKSTKWILNVLLSNFKKWDYVKYTDFLYFIFFIWLLLIFECGYSKIFIEEKINFKEENMKNNNGVSIITLIVTVVVIIILASFTIYYGLTKNVNEATNTKTVYEVHEIIDAVASRSLLNDLNSGYYKLVGKTEYEDVELTYDGETKVFRGSEGWYLVSEETEFRELGISNTTGEYLVNYDDGSVVSIKGVIYEDVTYYSMNDLKQQMGGGTTILSKVEYNSTKGVNEPILSKGMVPVKWNGEKWIVTTSDDEAWYDYSDQMAWANVMLMDELSVEGYNNDAIKKASLSELAGREVLTEGSAYVWIPRYTTTNIGGIGAKIIFSNLINDTTSANGENYTLPSSFTFGEGNEKIELTGIWISKYEAGFNE